MVTRVGVFCSLDKHWDVDVAPTNWNDATLIRTRGNRTSSRWGTGIDSPMGDTLSVILELPTSELACGKPGRRCNAHGMSAMPTQDAH
jgi:hypothetical protein